MITLKDFKKEIAWTMFDLTNDEIETLYNSVDTETYNNLDDLINDYDLDSHFVVWDVDLTSVLDYFRDWVNSKNFYLFDLYYLKDDNLFVGVPNDYY